MESVLEKPRDLCESLELSIVRIALETYRSCESIHETQIDTVCWGQATGAGARGKRRDGVPNKHTLFFLEQMSFEQMSSGSPPN